MATGLNRLHLQSVAEEKLADAQLLLSRARYSNAYYLAGYAIEIGLKACISRQMMAETLPEPKFVRSIYTHNLRELVGLAGLSNALEAEQDAHPAFGLNWGLVVAWDESVRYRSIDRELAETMVNAVGDVGDGVLRWVRKHW
jgi:HEPN domain-containing protein